MDDPQPPAPALLGGKGASLVRLVRAGLPVPPGFVILPAAFAAPAAGPGPSPEASLADGAGPQIEAAYAELGRRLGVADPPVAVRSSAVAEDLAGASFAGLYDTYLGVAGAGEVRRAAARCAASLWGVAVEAYRRSLEGAGKSLPAPSMAVVVQALVAADAAGVAFTVDPLSPEGRPLVVNASWGLGQSIVDGVVEGDTWRLDRETLAVTHQTIGDKPDRTPETADGPRLPVPEADRRRPSLQPEQVADVARLALQAEAVLGCPADVEWAVSGGRLFLLQARPITALPGPGAAGAGPLSGPLSGATSEARPAEAVLPFEWPEVGLEALHWRLEGGASAEPALPWEEEERQAGSRAGRNAALLLGGERYRRAFFWHGYRYTAEAPVPGTAQEREQRRWAFERPAEALHDLGKTYWETVLLPELEEGDQRLARIDPQALGASDLAAHLAEALAWYERLWTLHAFALRT
ncbi:MAG TPA: PEP/pyruvate-binding domain-containing protein, partial [Chloroflexota bacterium]|nr:PEP/pyruvate-binding domain-containing protein [Chloroflexota bacterium]